MYHAVRLQVTYALGIDVGTTYTAAATVRGGHAEAFLHDKSESAVPSVVFASSAGILFGGQAERRGAAHPEGLAREFKRRLGDPVPIVLSGSPYHAHRLIALMTQWVVDTVTEQVGAAPTSIAVTHPANWSEYRLDLLRQGLNDVGLGAVHLISEPAAAAWDYLSTTTLEPGARVLVYDLGGGTFDVALLRLKKEQFAHEVEPLGLERLGGIDFDEAVFQFALQSVPAPLLQRAGREPGGVAQLAHLRTVCVGAKESLSSNQTADIPIILPDHVVTARITRREFEQMIRPMVDQTLELVSRMLESARIGPEQLDAALLIGGSSRIPLVPQMLQEHLGIPVRVDAHPKLVVCKGAARRADRLASSQPLPKRKRGMGRFGPRRSDRPDAGRGPRPSTPQPAMTPPAAPVVEPAAAEPSGGPSTVDIESAPSRQTEEAEPGAAEPTPVATARPIDLTSGARSAVHDVEDGPPLEAAPPGEVQVHVEHDHLPSPAGTRRRWTPWLVAAATAAVVVAALAVFGTRDRPDAETADRGTVGPTVTESAVLPVGSAVATAAAVGTTTGSVTRPTSVSTTLPPAPPGFRRESFASTEVSFAVPEKWEVIDPATIELSDTRWATNIAVRTGISEQLLRATVGRDVPYVFSDDRSDSFVPNISVETLSQMPSPDDLATSLAGTGDGTEAVDDVTDAGRLPGNLDGAYADYVIDRGGVRSVIGKVIAVRVEDRVVLVQVRTLDDGDTETIGQQIISTISPTPST